LKLVQESLTEVGKGFAALKID